ncbi:MAG: hypothetical protein K6U74_17655 [Firmicutes bacterium]|nr:hypothetical protein [Bacillota bacterium]
MDQVLDIALLEKEAVDAVVEPEAAAALDDAHLPTMSHQEVQPQGGTQLPS